MLRTFTLRLRPTKPQAAAFEYILADSCETYNAALQERKEAWKLQRKSVTMFDQFRQLTQLRKDPLYASIGVEIQREPLRRVDRAFKDFFRRLKLGGKCGAPRFRSQSRYKSFAFGDKNIVFRGSSIKIPNLGWCNFKNSQQIYGVPKVATIKLIGKKWLVMLCCDIGPAPEKCAISNPIGIDLGLTNFVTLSDGTSIDNPRWTRKHEARIAAANRALARKQRHSKNRLRAKEVLRRVHQRAADARRNFTHHVSKILVGTYDLIAFEKLNIKGMVRGRMAKSILDAAWGELIWQITYKAEYAGKWAVPVNPKGTSIRCSQCGANVPKTLAVRQHVCVCGASLDRDHNAALNIKGLGMSLAGLVPSECYASSTTE
jgi:putative transposase